MNIIAVVDDRNGMMFNERRLSRDRVLTGYIEKLTAGSTLYMNEYSQPLFAGCDHIAVSADFLEEAESGTYCFVENVPLSPFLPRIEQIYLFHWNRRYPFDLAFDIDTGAGWHVTSELEFAGSSHDRISLQVFAKD